MQTINEAANNALDAAYLKSAGQVLLQIEAISNNRTSQMQVALARLDAEAQKLKEAKKKMAIDNPVLQQTLDAYESMFVTTQTLVTANDNDIQEAAIFLATIGVTAKVFLSLSSQLLQQGIDPVSPRAMKFYLSQLAQKGIGWEVPTTLTEITNFVDSPAWIARMEKWGIGYADLTRKTILQAIQDGSGPIATASKIREYAEKLPKSAADTLMRTLQLTSYREASLGMEKINGDFIEYKIRLAELDDVTCMSCVALHGTRLDVGERVDDHYNGRCTEYYVVPGGGLPEIMQADSTPGNRQFVPFQTGEEWFNSLPPDRQQQQASFQSTPAKWEAFHSGAITLQDFVAEHIDDTFGRQIVEESLVGILGADAEKYYMRNQ